MDELDEDGEDMRDQPPAGILVWSAAEAAALDPYRCVAVIGNSHPSGREFTSGRQKLAPISPLHTRPAGPG